MRIAALLLVAALLGGDRPPLRPAEAAAIDFTLPAPEEAWLGADFEARPGAPVIRAVEKGGPADHAGLRAGDHLAAVAGVEPPDAIAAAWMLRLRAPGERVPILFRRNGTAFRAEATLDRRPGEGAFFRGARFRLAVVPLSLEDLPRPAAPSDADLDRMYFAKDARSLRDYWRDQSFGVLEVMGRVLPTVSVPARREVFAAQPMGAGPDSLYARALGVLRRRDGEAALREFDGIAFLYPGEVASPPRKGLWPHRATIRDGSRLLPYFVKNLPGGGPDAIGVHCHEFGHLLGLPDQYGVAHRTGAGDFCLMAIGHRGGGTTGADRPFSLCAWCRAALRWARPVAVDPRKVQDLALSPIDQAGPGEMLLVPGLAGGEAFLLENRRRIGWDADLPGEGLLVWRVGGDADDPLIDLVEAHGIRAPDAAMLRPDAVPFPARGRDALTEETHPGRAGVLRLSRIVRHLDGTITFRIGDPAPASAPPAEEAVIAVDREGFALLPDPITGEVVRVFMGPPEETPARDAAEVEAGEPVAGD